MQYATANKLTYAASEELLKLLQILCPSPNSLPTSLYICSRTSFSSLLRLLSNDFILNASLVLTKGKHAPNTVNSGY